MVLTDEENFLTPAVLEMHHCVFSSRKAAVPTSKRSFAL